MVLRTEGIVLKTTPFSDADLIVTYLTADYGLIKAFAKSPRKIKSGFGSSLEPFTHARIACWGKENAPLPRLTQSDIIASFQPLREKVDCFVRVAEIAELTLGLLPDREPNRDVFSLLLRILGKIEGSGAAASSSTINCLLYKIKFLDLAGYGPRLEGCARCGSAGYTFYISHGSIICESCAQGNDSTLRLSPGVVRLYGTMRRWDLSIAERIKVSRLFLDELSTMLDTHILYTTSKPLRTRAFLDL